MHNLVYVSIAKHLISDFSMFAFKPDALTKKICFYGLQFPICRVNEELSFDVPVAMGFMIPLSWNLEARILLKCFNHKN